jgi:hypothetical protein
MGIFPKPFKGEIANERTRSHAEQGMPCLLLIDKIFGRIKSSDDI